jgi:uncharacterized protein (TIGR04222 family)
VTTYTTATTPEELGCLTGGPARAAEVALARLLHGGLIRISRAGLVTGVRLPGQGPSSPLEAQILTGLRAGGRFLGDVVSGAASSAEAASLRSHLVDRGLLRAWRSFRPRLYPWLFLVALGLTLGGLVEGVRPNYLAVAAAVLVLALVLRARDPGRLRTRAGHLLAKRAADRRPEHPLDAVAVLGLRGKIGRRPVAELFGLTPEIVRMLPGRDRRSSSCGSGGCGGGCSSGSSCSSGDGGGGCGGGGGD